MRTYILVVLVYVLCLSGVTHADEPHPDLRNAVRLSTDAYSIKGQQLPAPYDREALAGLQVSTSVPAREIAELRLGVEELRAALQAKREETQQAIIGGAAIAAPLVSAGCHWRSLWAARVLERDATINRPISVAGRLSTGGVVQTLL